MQPDLTTLRTGAETAASEASKLTESIPGLLTGLKQNLTSIFTQNNPMFQERENALQTFLNVPSQTRAELLPSNQPIIAGRALNYSPTAQESMVTARQNAALVPLAGFNQSIVGQYGNLADMLSSAGGVYSTQAQAAQNKAVNAKNLYDSAIAEYNAITSRQKAGEGGGLDLSALIMALLSGQNQKPDISTFDQPDTGTEIPPGYELLPGTNTIIPSVPYKPLDINNLGLNNIPINLGLNQGTGLNLAGGGSNSLGGTGIQFKL